jgi:hypothetical protein
VDELSDDEIVQIFRHELAHLVRFDTWITLATKAAITLFPLSPALYYIEHQISRLREVACDDAVLQSTVSPYQYATCLARVAEATRGPRPSLATMFVGGQSQLTLRIEHILAGRKSEGRKSLLLLTTGVMIAMLAFVSLQNSRELVSFAPETSPVMQVSQASPIANAPASMIKTPESSLGPQSASVHPASLHRIKRHRSASPLTFLAGTKRLPSTIIRTDSMDSLVVLLPETRGDSKEAFILVVSTVPAKERLEKRVFSLLQI